MGLLFINSSNIAFADISKDQLYDYLKVSIVGDFFSSYHFDTLIKLAEQGLDKTSLKKMAHNEKYIKLYAHNFMELNESEYTQLMKFYNTEVGKKYKKSMLSMSKINKTNYKPLYEINKCAKEKQALINSINKKLNILQYKQNFATKYLYIINSILINKLEKSIYDSEIKEIKYSDKLMENEKIFSCILYKDFTLNDLNKMYSYASTNAIQKETQLMYEGFDNYISVFFEDIEKIKEMKGSGDNDNQTPHP